MNEHTFFTNSWFLTVAFRVDCFLWGLLIDYMFLALQMMGRTLRGTRTRRGQTTRWHPEDKASQVWLTLILCHLFVPPQILPARASRSAPPASFDLGDRVCLSPLGMFEFFLPHWFGWLFEMENTRGFEGVVIALSRCFLRFLRSVCLSHSASCKRLLIQDLFLL